MPELPLEGPVVFYDVSAPVFAGLSRVLPAEVLHYLSGEGTLEFTRNVIENVSWEDYEAILAAFGERRFRHTYADGTLEMMSPTEEHEWIARFLGRLAWMVAYRFKIPIKSVGSTTRRRRAKSRGLEPDESFYIQHEREVRGRRSRSATEGPPPDLAIEVEITHQDVSRLEAYARLGVPEVWRYAEGEVEFHVLQADGDYRSVPRSEALPMLESSAVTQFLSQVDDSDEITLIDKFVSGLGPFTTE